MLQLTPVREPQHVSRILKIRDEISEHGFDPDHPISFLIFRDKIYCMGGNHRLAAMRMLDINPIPSLIMVQKRPQKKPQKRNPKK